MAVVREIQASPVRHMTRAFTWMKPKQLDDVLNYTVEPLNRLWQTAEICTRKVGPFKNPKGSLSFVIH